MGFFERIFGLEEEQKDYFDEDEYRENPSTQEELDALGKCEDYSYEYNKPQILETIKGSYEAWEKANVKEPMLNTIIAKRRAGKTALTMALASNLCFLKKEQMQVIGFNNMDSNILPNYINIINDINEIRNDSILCIPEGAVFANSRTSMTKKNIGFSKLLPIISHKDIPVFFNTQGGGLSDKNAISVADSIILMKFSFVQCETERPLIKKLYNRYSKYLDKWEKKLRSHKGIAIILSDEFKGVIKCVLPSYWCNEISKSYSEPQEEI